MSVFKKILNWLPALLWMALIFFMSSQTGLAGPEWMSVAGHIVEYGGLAALLYFALSRTTGLAHLKIAAVAAVMATLYGLTDEWHQSFVPGRVPDVMDLLTDFSASTLVAMSAALALRRATKR